MSKIFISYSQQDSAFINLVKSKLLAQGHQITVDVDSISPGQNWRKALSEGLKRSEIFLVFLSNHSMNSQFVLSEIGTARAYSEESERMLLVPVLIDEIAIPPVVQDLYVITAADRNIDNLVHKIEKSISNFLGKQVAKDKKKEQINSLIEENSAVYIEEAIALLSKLKSRNEFFGNTWYFAGFSALVIGIYFITSSVATLSSIGEKGWLEFSILALKSIVVIGLLGACSKYAFTLGKSFMSESLKSADRMHAISFGKFYLKVYGSDATWPELKEVFQHWNIDRSSSFSSQTTAEFDPKIIESMLELIRAFGKNQSNKK